MSARLGEPGSVPGVTHRFVAARGVRFHVAEAGPVDGAPVLMLHGWPQHWFCWRDVMRTVADAGLRAIAIDLPGYGWSSPPPHRWGKDDVVADIVALLDELGLERVGLMGHDWGGFLGFRLAIAHPDRVSAYLPLNITHPHAEIPPRELVRFYYQPLVAFAGVPLQRHTPLVDVVLTLATANRKVLGGGVRQAFSHRFREPSVARAASMTYRTFLLHEVLDVVRRTDRRPLTVKTRMLFGTADPAITPAMADGGGEDYAMELVDGVGHFIVDERPDLVAQRAVELFA